jgi:acetyl esterase/lipase
MNAHPELVKRGVGRQRRDVTLPPRLAEFRQQGAAAIAANMWRTDPPAREETVDGIRVLRFAPPGPKRGTVLHFHGGGFALGCPDMIGAYAAALAARCNVEVICAAYRLAPEHPFPNGIADALTVLQALQKAGEKPLFVSGDSAGGGIAASVTKLAVMDRVPLAGLILIAPWLDMTVGAASFTANAATDPLFSRASAEEMVPLYLDGVSPRDELASPVFGSVAGFPPTYISIGAGEVLADDGHNFHRALTAAGVTARLHAIDGMEHVAVTRDLSLHGAPETFAAIAEFIDKLV